MFKFPSINCVQSQSWLNVEQSAGQELSSKMVLRQNFRRLREDYKKKYHVVNRPWGADHISLLLSFLRQHFSQINSPCDPWPLTWTCYFPIGSELELLGHCSMEHCWLPCDQPNGELLWFKWNENINNWAKDSRGLPRPPVSLPLKEFDSECDGPWLVITPCLAADLSGTRLGYGGGFYDRFLSKNKDKIFSVACVPSQLLLSGGALPKETFDEPVDCIVTEEGVFLLAVQKFDRLKNQLLNSDRG